MKLREIMVRSVETIDPGSPIAEAAQKMRRANVGMLPVLDRGRVVGIVTDRDLVIRGLSNGIEGGCVRDAMTPDPVCLLPDAEVDLAIRTMKENRIGRLLITDEIGRLLGVLTAADVAVAYSGDLRVGQLATTLGSAHRRPSSLAV